MYDAAHLKIITGVEKTCGSTLLGRYVILYNSNKVTLKQVRRIAKAEEYSPYVLMLPEDQFYGLFRDASPEERAQREKQRESFFFDEEDEFFEESDQDGELEKQAKNLLNDLWKNLFNNRKER